MIAIAEAATCRRALLLRCFGEEPEATGCGACDICRSPPRMFDGTVAAQKLLSAVVRTGQRFGVGHVVDVLRGRLTDKVAQFAHDRLPTFGVGKDLPDAAWRGVARQLVARGALDVAVGNHGELVATEAARAVLRGAEPVMLREDAVQSAPKRAAAAASDPPVGSGEPVFEALRAWRRGVAQAQSVPAYVVADDRTLAGIAARRPGSIDDLLEVPGMGRSRVERYGAEILRILRENG
jgi:ATP-dependent DNA helicase RecQ